jgi:hypothetical protein
MHMEALDRLVADLFTAHGFKVTQDAALEGRTGTVYGAPVLAENDRGALVIERRGPGETVSAADVEEFVRVIQDTGAHHGLLLHLGAVSPGAAAQGEGVLTLWGSDTLARLVGEACLHGATGSPLAPLPIAWEAPVAESEEAILGGAFDDLLPAAFQDDFAPAAQEPGPPEPFVPFDLAVFDSLADEAPVRDLQVPEADAEADLWGAVDFTLGSEATPGPGGQAPRTSHPALPPRITAEQAAATVRDRLFSVTRAELVLQPVHLADYECDLLIEGSLRYDTLRGRLEVHGTRKSVRDVDPFLLDPAKARPLPAEVGRSVEEKPLRVAPERAMELARDHLMATHTRIVEIETMDEENDVAFMERKRVAPRPDQLRIEPMGIVERPYWRLRGRNGAVLVDALTGEVTGEELRTYDPDAVVVD